MNRILWNRRPDPSLHYNDIDREGCIDEIVLDDVRSVHVEQMADRCWWIGVYMGGAEDPYWMGNFVCDSRGRMRFVEQENAGIEWGEDDTHEVES